MIAAKVIIVSLVLLTLALAVWWAVRSVRWGLRKVKYARADPLQKALMDSEAEAIKFENELDRRESTRRIR